MPARATAPAPTRPAAPTGSAAGYLIAPVLPALVVAAPLLLGTPVTMEVQRLALLVAVALVGVLFGAMPGVVAAVVATALGWFHADVLRFVITLPDDRLAIGTFAATALAVALAAGARRGAPAVARQLQARLAVLEPDAAAQRATAARLVDENTSLRAAIARSDAEARDAREAAERDRAARWALVASLPPELRAPHVVVPAMPPIFPPIHGAPLVGPIASPSSPSSPPAE